jgi:acyl-CoA thioesterase YciA
MLAPIMGEPSTSPSDGGADSRGRLALRVMPMPKDTNPYGSVFGGVILSYIDQAGFIEARRHGLHRWVTVAIDRVEFKQPVGVGDVVNLYARTVRQGRTSVTVEVDVEAERYGSAHVVHVTAARLVMVATDDQGRAIPFTRSTAATETRAGGEQTGGQQGQEQP